jgi:cbb3-type cytochrome oxidase subunit 3
VSQIVLGWDTSPLAWLGTSMTVSFFACFVGWTLWAYAPGNKARHEEASKLPFEGGEP